ncbi:MAG: DUF6691 family protein [Kofleriaceae bacterium]
MSAATCGARCRVMSLVLAGLAGAVFGVGLLVSGMTQPAKVIGFLDLFGDWDPSLGFVMGGAVVVNLLALRATLATRQDPWFDQLFHLPSRQDLDLPLLAGAAVFGVGWGLGGLCPGPGLVSAAGLGQAGLVFTAAMVVGMVGLRWLRTPPR